MADKGDKKEEEAEGGWCGCSGGKQEWKSGVDGVKAERGGGCCGGETQADGGCCGGAKEEPVAVNFKDSFQSLFAGLSA